MKWLNKIIEKIIIKRFDKIITPELEKIKKVLSYFETGVDVHMRKDSIIIMLRKDKPQVRFWNVKHDTLQDLIRHIERSQPADVSVAFDAGPIVTSLLYEELRRNIQITK